MILLFARDSGPRHDDLELGVAQVGGSNPSGAATYHEVSTELVLERPRATTRTYQTGVTSYLT